MDGVDLSQLENMPYNSLRCLAKQYGVKGNIKAEKMRKELGFIHKKMKNTFKASGDSPLMKTKRVSVNLAPRRSTNKDETTKKPSLRADCVKSVADFEDFETQDIVSSPKKTILPPELEGLASTVVTVANICSSSSSISINKENSDENNTNNSDTQNKSKQPRKKKLGTKKSTTKGVKDFSAIHARQFQKMASIDDYLVNKQKRMVSVLASSGPKAKISLEETREALRRLKATANTPTSPVKKVKLKGSNPSRKSPRLSNTNGDNKRTTLTSSIPVATKSFIPTIVSSKDANLSFRSMMRLAPTNSCAGNQGTRGANTSLNSTHSLSKHRQVKFLRRTNELNITFDLNASNAKSNRTPSAPAVIQQCTPKSTTRLTQFNLQQSLKKPLKYTPYKGKIKPLPELKGEESVYKKHEQLYKAPKTRSGRESRREATLKIRATKKTAATMLRRKLNNK